MTCKPRGKIYSINEVQLSSLNLYLTWKKIVWILKGYEEHWENAVKEYVRSKKKGSNPYGSRLVSSSIFNMTSIVLFELQ